MMHPTATDAAPACGPLPMTFSPEVFHPLWMGGTPLQPKTVFYSPMANFLEMSAARFHYSVIGGYAMIALAPGRACQISNDEAAALEARGDTAGACARAGEE